MRITKIIIGILVLGLISCKSNPQTKYDNPIVQKNPTEYDGLKFPKPVGYVNDYEGILTESQKTELESFLADYEQDTSREVVLVTVSSIKPYDRILDYAKDLGNEWGVGKIDKDNGLLIIVNIGDRDIGISTGHGTEKILTDSICKLVIDQTIIPEFKDGQYYSGIKKGFTGLMASWK